MLKNKLQNVTLPIAVSAEMGKMEMYKDTVSGGRTSSLFQEFVGTHFEGKTETVEVTTFEELIHRFGAPDFVKVDVEGAELSIFEKADKLPTQTIYFIEVLIGNRFWPSGALARSLKPKACVSMGAE